MGGSARYRYTKKVEKINADTSLSDFERETLLQDADMVYQEQLRGEQLRKEQRKNGVNPNEVPKSLRTFDGHDNLSKKIYENSPKEARENIDAALENIRQAIEKHEFRRRINESTVEKILKSGRIMNQIEAHTTMGYYSPDERMAMSKEVFQHDDSLKPADYEKYGYLGNGESVAASTYGDLDIVFKKDRLMDRTTITYGDSLFERLAASRVTNPGIASMYGEDTWRAYGDKMDEFDSQIFRSQSRTLLDTGRAWGYAELQYHGDVTLDDIDHFSVPTYWENNPAHERTIKLIESYGIKVTYDDKQ